MKKLNKVLVLFLIITTLMMLEADIFFVNAANKPKLNVTSMSIPCGKLSSDVSWLDATTRGHEMATNLTVKYKKKGATYQFVSSNKNIVTVNQNGMLTGVKVGRATVTCRQTYKKKTTTIGKCQIRVNNTSIDTLNGLGEWHELGTKTFPNLQGNQSNGYLCMIFFRNPDAKYTFEADRSGVQMTDKKASTGKSIIPGKYYYPQTYIANEAGIYTITVKEAYKGKTRKIGDFKLDLRACELISRLPIVEDDDEYVHEFEDSQYKGYFEDYHNDLLGVGEKMNLFRDLRYNRKDIPYYFEIVDATNTVESNIGYFLDNSGSKEKKTTSIAVKNNSYKTSKSYFIVGNKQGKLKIKVTEQNAKGKLVGYYNLEVKEIHTEKIEGFDEEVLTYIGEPYRQAHYAIRPYNSMDKVEVSINDTNIIETKINLERNDVLVVPKKVGDAIITIKSGNKTLDIKVKVFANYNDMHDYFNRLHN